MGKLPAISGKNLIKILKKQGFTIVRQRGSHVSLKKVTQYKTFRTVVPLHKTLAKGTLNDILRQAGLSKEEFAKLE